MWFQKSQVELQAEVSGSAFNGNVIYKMKCFIKSLMPDTWAWAPKQLYPDLGLSVSQVLIEEMQRKAVSEVSQQREKKGVLQVFSVVLMS